MLKIRTLFPVVRGAGDAVSIVAKPIANAIDAVTGSDLKNCGGCERRRQKLNEKFPMKNLTIIFLLMLSLNGRGQDYTYSTNLFYSFNYVTNVFAGTSGSSGDQDTYIIAWNKLNHNDSMLYQYYLNLNFGLTNFWGTNTPGGGGGGGGVTQAALNSSNYIAGTIATNSFQPTNANLTAWATVGTNLVAYLNGIAGSNFVTQTGLNSSNYIAGKQATNSFQGTNANLSAWAAYTTTGYTNQFSTGAYMAGVTTNGLISGTGATNSFQGTNAFLSQLGNAVLTNSQQIAFFLSFLTNNYAGLYLQNTSHGTNASGEIGIIGPTGSLTNGIAVWGLNSETMTNKLVPPFGMNLDYFGVFGNSSNYADTASNTFNLLEFVAQTNGLKTWSIGNGITATNMQLGTNGLNLMIGTYSGGGLGTGAFAAAVTTNGLIGGTGATNSFQPTNTILTQLATQNGSGLSNVVVATIFSAPTFATAMTANQVKFFPLTPAGAGVASDVLSRTQSGIVAPCIYTNFTFTVQNVAGTSISSSAGTNFIFTIRTNGTIAFAKTFVGGASAQMFTNDFVDGFSFTAGSNTNLISMQVSNIVAATIQATTFGWTCQVIK